MNNWNQKWILENGAVCLLGKVSVPVKEQTLDTWAFDDDEEPVKESVPTDIKARLWSGKIPAKYGMQCLTLAFSISPVAVAQDKFSLSLLQRQEG